MSIPEGVINGSFPAPAPAPRLPLLQEIVIRQLGIRTGRRKLSPQDLVAMLFRQRARARQAALPRVTVHVSVFTPSGRPAVQISL